MTFVSPSALLLLALIPLGIAAYALLMKRRGAAAGSAFGVPKTTTGKPLVGWRRHLPMSVFGVAAALLMFSLARPMLDVSVPERHGTIMLAFDTSNSMVADDVEPSRLDAARAAAQSVIDDQASTIEVGVVSFADGGLILIDPTDSRLDVDNAVDRLTVDGGTSLAEGIFAALTAITGPIETTPGADVDDLDVGSFSNSAIVLFTDGEERGDTDPLPVAELAANAGVKIFTVGVGTTEGTVVDLDGFTIATSLKEDLLIEIAETTGGTHLQANDLDGLASIGDAIDLQFVSNGERIEITALLAVGSIAMLLVGTWLSMRTFGRVP